MAEGKKRGVCPECGRSVLVRKDDGLRTHNDLSQGEPFQCPGSTWIPEECAAEMRRYGYTPHPEYLLSEEADRAA